MKPDKREEIECPCCKECRDCTSGFQKVVDLKNAGLVIYRHTTHTEDVNTNTGLVEFATKVTEDVFILHNTNDIEITPADYLPEMDKNKINCPRCQRILDHAQKLIEKVPTINKNDVKGICEHCRKKETPCFECEEIAKKFVFSKFDRTESNKERVKLWLTKIKRLLKDAVIDNNETAKGRIRAQSELYIDQLCRELPKADHEPDVEQMFDPEMQRSNFAGVFPPSIEKRNKMFAYFPQLEKLEHPVIFRDSGGNLNNPTTSRTDERINTNDEYQVYSDTESADLRAMFYRPLTETDTENLERVKHIELRAPVPPVPFHSEDNFTTRSDENVELGHFQRPIKRPKSRYASDDEPESLRVSREEESRIREVHELKRKFRGKTVKSTRESQDKKVVSPNLIRKYHSEDALLASVAGTAGDLLTQGFSYVFPKVASAGKRKLKRVKSSSELIKDTQDMLLARAEEEKKRLDEERKLKLESEERKRRAREERKKQMEEKKKADDENKRMEALEKAESEKKHKHDTNTDEAQNASKKSKKEKLTDSVSTATSKSKLKESRPIPDKKETKPKSDSKGPKDLKQPKDNKEPKDKKEPKEAKQPIEKKEPKVDKEALKEAEKAKKEQEKKDKEEKLKKEKEEKEKLKKEKEEQARKDKELKQKEKDLKQREKEDLQRGKVRDDNLKQKSKAKEEAPLKQNDQELSKQKDKERVEREAADKKAREEAKLRLKNAKEEDNTKPEPVNQKLSPKVEKPNTKDLNIKHIKVRRPSPDDLILRLVKLKQSAGNRIRPKRLSDMMLTPKDVKVHRTYHKNNKAGTCIMCLDSDLELDAESLDLKKEKDETADIIIGQKVFKYKPPLKEKRDEQAVVPLFFQSAFDEAALPVEIKEATRISPREAGKKQPGSISGKQAKHVEQEVPKGVIRYALSDRSFIDKGWTMLPTEKVVRKMNVYRMRPAHPEFDWFEHNKTKRLMQYDSGEKLAEFDDNGRGRWFYRNGRLALDYYDAEELNAQQRFVIYSSGEPDERGRARPYTLLATFDYLGNGIVFDHSGKIRLKYNQTEGVVLDRSIGPVSHWKWHTLNDPPVLQQVMIDTQMAHKDPGIMKLGSAHDEKPRPDNEDMLAIEFDNFIKEKSKKLSQSFKPFQIKMKALKINEHFSLKVLDQATVYLIFRDGTTNLKLNIGMVLDHKEIVDTDTAEVGEVSNNMERLPARTDSLAGLQQSVAHAQRYERSRVERERRLRPSEPCGSADKLTGAASRPLRFPLRTVPSSSTTTASGFCKCRKPTTCNLYYDNRLC